MPRSAKSVKRTELLARGDGTAIRSSYRLRARRQGTTRDRAIATSVATRCSRWSEGYRKCGYCLVGLLIVSLCAALACTLFPYPLHASCVVKWKFREPCVHVMQRLRCQIINWSSWNVCRHRDGNCLYTLELPTKENVIRAMHVTSPTKTTERLEIAFEEVNNTCRATAASVSDEWLAVFDHGRNYCNLRNLLVAADLGRHSTFLQTTSDAVCTQFNMAFCG